MYININAVNCKWIKATAITRYIRALSLSLDAGYCCDLKQRHIEIIWSLREELSTERNLKQFRLAARDDAIEIEISEISMQVQLHWGPAHVFFMSKFLVVDKFLTSKDVAVLHHSLRCYYILLLALRPKCLHQQRIYNPIKYQLENESNFSQKYNAATLCSLDTGSHLSFISRSSTFIRYCLNISISASSKLCQLQWQLNSSYIKTTFIRENGFDCIDNQYLN